MNSTRFSKTILILAAALLTLTRFASAQAPAAPLVPSSAAVAAPAEYDVTVFTNEAGELYLNGASVLKTQWADRSYKTKLTLKKGDILTANVTDPRGGLNGQFAILIVKPNSNKPFITTKDFRYETEVKGEWQKDASLAGFRVPKFNPLTSVRLSDSISSDAAKDKDHKHATLFFKCIVP